MAVDLHVSGGGSDATGDGTEANPFRTISRGVAAASAGDTIRVHAGTYDQAAGEVFPIEKPPRVGIVGDDPSSCVVDGVSDQPVFRFPPSELFSELDPLEGLTIQGGSHGVSVDLPEDLSISARPTITRNVIRNNADDGIHYITSPYGEPSSPLIMNNTIEGNGGAGVGARYFDSGNINPIITYNYIHSNGYSGVLIDMGAFMLPGTPNRLAVISNNVIRENLGSGVRIDAGYSTRIDAVITNNMITGNGPGGAGITLRSYLSGISGAYGTLVNNTITGNSEMEIHVSGRTRAEVINTIAWGGGLDLQGDSSGFALSPLSVSWSDFETTDGWVDTSGPGNISVDPMFRDAPGGDFRLASSSPCIDAGTSERAPTADLVGNPRVDVAGVPNTGGGAEPWYDMGALEFVGIQDADGDTVAELADCDDQNPDVWLPPGEVRDLEVSRIDATAVLEWAEATGGGVAGSARYDVATGVVGELTRDGGYASATCLAGDLAAPTHADLRPGPPSGVAWYYLVRAENDCPEGEGTFGDAPSTPDPRDLLDDPALSPVSPCP